MFESDFADSRVSLILAIFLIKKSLREQVWYCMNYPEVYVFLCKMYFILSHNFLGCVMFSVTKLA